MEQSTDARQPASIGLEELPYEVLVYIFLLLPTLRDIVRLRYVSRKIRSILSETPSLWNIFLWPWYDKREERSLYNVLEVCGTHVNRLVFPDVVSCVRGTSVHWHKCGDLPPRDLFMASFHIKDFKEKLFVMAPSTAMKMLRYCCNVTEVTLGTCLNGDQVKEIVKKMKHLKKLDMCHSTSIPIKPIMVAASCGSLESLVLRGVDASCIRHDHLPEWVRVRFQPPNLSIVVHENIDVLFQHYLLKILQKWQLWNIQIPAGHTACFKFYFTECNPWDTCSATPVLQLDFGKTATYPFVKAKNFGLSGFDDNLLLLTNSASNGKVDCKASVMRSDGFSFCMRKLCCDVSGLSFLTDFTATRRGLLCSHLEQLSVACPNLERLNLSGNPSCLESLKGLRNIVYHCHKLQAINLENIHVTKIQNCMELWELLSEIKMLNHLRIEMCTMKSFIEIVVCSQHSIVKLALKFMHLKRLELMFNDDREAPCIPSKDDLHQAYPVLLSQFPSLVCCFVENRIGTIVVDMITKCKHLKYFKYNCNCWEPLFGTQPLSAAPNKHLQYLDIYLREGKIDEAFMDSVSAHGELKTVLLYEVSVTEAGITALIENSPKLCLFKIHFYTGFFIEKHKQLKTFKDMLTKKFLHRKLFNLDGFIMTGRVDKNYGSSPVTL